MIRHAFRDHTGTMIENEFPDEKALRIFVENYTGKFAVFSPDIYGDKYLMMDDIIKKYAPMPTMGTFQVISSQNDILSECKVYVIDSQADALLITLILK